MKRKSIAILLIIVTLVAFVSCNKGSKNATESKPMSEVDKVIAEAQKMSLEELAKKAIEESNGKTFFGLGNSSRGKSALPLFISYLQTIDPSYTLNYEWQQPKNNKIFDQLTADGEKATGTFAMTLIQDGNQIESKMVQPGILKRFIPKDWADANSTTAEQYEGYLALQTLSKIFMFNNTGKAEFKNAWDFVTPGSHPLFMGIDSEVIGKNFLYMLTSEKYSKYMKDAYNALPSDKKATFEPTIKSLESKAKELGLGNDAAYSLAWIKLWVENYNEQTDDGPICNTLVQKSATDQSGLIVYSKIRSVEESANVSVNNITVAAYQDDYEGIGGYAYCHYLFLTDNSPLPWTACAFIAYMTCTVDGFSAWGKDMGGYSSNPVVMSGTEAKYHHSTAGFVDGVNKFPAKNDRGYDWWINTGKLVVEDPKYCALSSFRVGAWIDSLKKYNK